MKQRSGCCVVNIYCTAVLTLLSDSVRYVTFLFSEWHISYLPMILALFYLCLHFFLQQRGGKDFYKSVNFAGYVGIFSGIKPVRLIILSNTITIYFINAACIRNRLTTFELMIDTLLAENCLVCDAGCYFVSSLYTEHLQHNYNEFHPRFVTSSKYLRLCIRGEDFYKSVNFAGYVGIFSGIKPVRLIIFFSNTITIDFISLRHRRNSQHSYI